MTTKGRFWDSSFWYNNIAKGDDYMLIKDISDYNGKIINGDFIDIDKIPNFNFRMLCDYIELQVLSGRKTDDISNEEIMLFRAS